MSLRKTLILRLTTKNANNLRPARWVRTVAAVLLPVLLFCMVGIPLPSAGSKHSAERFPCENSPCSCNSAAACWDHCCCHTDDEKLVWAEKNGVKPPKFLVDRVAAKRKSLIGSDVTLASSQAKNPVTKACGCSTKATKSEIVVDNCSKEKKSCNCSKCAKATVKSSCCGVRPEKAKLDYCEQSVNGSEGCCGKAATQESGKQESDDQAALAKTDSKKLKLVLFNAALKCKGIQLAFSILSNCLPTFRITFILPMPTQIDLLVIEDETAFSVWDLPEDPVPRQCA